MSLQNYVVISPPNHTAWRAEFERTALQLGQVLGNNMAIIHHIGSTAIPGIYAKPIIDLMPTVYDISLVEACVPAMEALGFEYLGEFGLPGRRYFRKNDAQEHRTHNVHMYQADNPEALRHIIFRDFMIAHPAHAQAYSDLKRTLAQAHPGDIQAYMDGKDAFVKEMEQQALAWRAAHPRKIAVAIIQDSEGRLVMQLRDDLPYITSHNMWGFFGGQVELGEDPFAAIMREINEELNIVADRQHIRLLEAHHVPPDRTYYVYYYEAGHNADNAVLGEGQRIGRFAPETVMHSLKSMPAMLDGHALAPLAVLGLQRYSNSFM
jgi:GrpB-like predicted nucleotidyltransferase (UPF0157 family)